VKDTKLLSFGGEEEDEDGGDAGFTGNCHIVGTEVYVDALHRHLLGAKFAHIVHSAC
jgi:hypothetical protein